MLRKIESLKCKAFPQLPVPFSPVQSALKLAEVLGVSLNKSIYFEIKFT